jgi:hypothetical protein
MNIVRPGRALCLTMLLATLLANAPLAAEEFDFDIGHYGKKSWELSGYLELGAERLGLDRDAVFSTLRFPAGVPDSAERYRGVLELSGLYRWERISLNGRLHVESVDDVISSRDNAAFYEAYLQAQPDDRLSLELGKRALRWGKGYAFNPVAFLERPKDPSDPDLSREGFSLASLDYVRSFDGALRTLALTPVLLPVEGQTNDEFGSREDLNIALKLYLLYRDTDIDILLRSGDSRPDALGLDFSRNLSSNFEIHGELAWFEDRPVSVLNSDNSLGTRNARPLDWLLGLRYLTEDETTWIVEYYHNGSGYSGSEMRQFYDLARASVLNPALRNAAGAAQQAGFGTPQPMRDYLYLRVTQKEPFDALYWSAGLTAIINPHDRSASLTPELSYTGIDNLELRGRAALLTGGRNSDFGERQNDWRVELRARYFF